MGLHVAYLTLSYAGVFLKICQILRLTYAIGPMSLYTLQNFLLGHFASSQAS